MSDIKLNIPNDQNEDMENIQDQAIVLNSNFLADLDEHQIALHFAELARNNTDLIIPIGFPAAGKSLLLSSMLWYARTSGDKFSIEHFDKGPFSKGRIVADDMVRQFHEGKVYGKSAVNTIDLIGLELTPMNWHKRKLSVVDLAFLDLAGEDVKKIKTSEGQNFTAKINAVFNGLQSVSNHNSSVIFLLITPFNPNTNPMESSLEAHNREDTLHFDFLNYLSQNQPRIINKSQFFIVVSKWDENPDQNQPVEEYIQINRPQIYSYVKDKPVYWGYYSIGRILESKVGGVVLQNIVERNDQSPHDLWRALYKVITNQSLDKKTFWEMLFG